MKSGKIVDGMLFLRLSSMKSGKIVDGSVADKKETPSKGCLHKVLRYTRLLIKRSSNVNSASNCTTYHRVVTDAEESHHLNVCRN